MRLPTVLALTMAALTAMPAARIGAQDAEPAASPASDTPELALDDTRAREHFAAGHEHFEAARFGDAAREFALAYELSRRPEMLVNLARAHERDGALRAAIADLELLLAQHPTSSYRGEAEERLARMRNELRAQERAQAAQRPVEGPKERPGPLAKAPAPPGPTRLTWTARGLFAGAIGLGVVTLATGVRAHRIYGDLDRECPGGLCEGEFEADRDRGRALARASTAFTALSLAAAAGGLVTWAIDRRARRRAGSSESRAHLPLVLGGRF